MAHSRHLKDQIFATVKAKSDGIDGPGGKILVSGDLPTGPIDGMVALWDERSSTVTPDEDVFYLVALLRSALENGEETQTLEYLSNQNRQILKFCDETGIGIKQYLPHYTTQKEWIDHFGEKWSKFYARKTEFDPRHILATGQRIFKPSFNHQADSSCRWDERSSTVTPDEDVFYLVALLRSASENGEETQTIEYLSNQNRQILRFCDKAGISIKQYLPHYTTQKEWMNHFGEKWSKFYTRKTQFDPRHILATGRHIFKPGFNHQNDSS
ncbi:hypothetical protein RJ640_020894 [Escallonia rubra]|uniref:Cytokinin dehydrogenase 1 FAD/cytokinin binding domain-containing protein n=1 Tax=Escallonia rubra TaxID=112253 RepID=A0AA88U4L5_9ASTE|nr:hypothetical protein RJ640_020894 [Escallonia rubra]